MKTKQADPITTWVIIRDSASFEGSFDNERSAIERLKSFSRYLGYFRIVPMTDKEFNYFIRGVNRIVTQKVLARAYGLLDGRYSK